MAEIEKKKALLIAKNLIDHETSVLDTRYSKSHEKVAIIFNKHIIEIIGGDDKFLKYIDLKIPLKNKEYSQLYKQFMDKVKKNKLNSTIEKFNQLELSVDGTDKK